MGPPRRARARLCRWVHFAFCHGHLLHTEHEHFIDFLAVRKIPLVEHARFALDMPAGESLNEDEDPEVTFAQAKIRELLLTDRGLNDKAAKAYVSFVRAYSKHEASYIFRLRDLDLVGVAKCFGLLRLPRMPELDRASRAGWEDADVDVRGLHTAHDDNANAGASGMPTRMRTSNAKQSG